jgi:Ni,Fe-hydrogenase III large subunit
VDGENHPCGIIRSRRVAPNDEEKPVAYVLAFDPPLSGRESTRLLATVEADTVIAVDYREATVELLPTERVRRAPTEQALALLATAVPTQACAYSLAYCQALESLLRLEVPPRAAALRTAQCEIERITSHVRQVHALLSLLGLKSFDTRLSNLVERLQLIREGLHGNGATFALFLPGGVTHDIDTIGRDELLPTLADTLRRLVVLANAVIEQRALPARTVDVGTVTRSAAEQFMLRGPVARAAGMSVDLRLDAPYAAYDRVPLALVTQEGGDVYARLVLLLLEAVESAKIVDHVLRNLPEGPARGVIPQQLTAGSAVSAVEAPQGPLHCRLESDGHRLSELAFDAYEPLDRLLIRTLLDNASLDDVALIVCSVAMAS